MKLFLCDARSNQKALAHKIHAKFKIDGIIVVNQKVKKLKRTNFKLSLKRISNFIGFLLTFGQFRKAWFGMLSYYEKNFSEFPIKPLIEVHDINQIEVEKIILTFKPELVLVSGTNILQQKLLNIINQYGVIMNLHTGISPYIKGGPDCTFWCLYLKEFDLIGNTIMWIDSGIDSGNIISTEQTKLNGDESLLDLKIKNMNHGHSLYLRAIELFLNKKILPNVSQSFFKPQRLFLSKNWGLKEQFLAYYNFSRYFNKRCIQNTLHKLVDLNSR
ncbi:hypothetical protein HA152_06330 [Prochlorococcus marinus XMU1412]|uniref:hypothetical protein n=1 Tax=Prochlorococcus marinus TaxID=1219 RepID=UPI001ADD3F17|nr:hypothetical protein [Prochlorococcus marinus]MBO8240319.1 hypothetical protein [Prochlorococcus marinus XMU1412]